MMALAMVVFPEPDSAYQRKCFTLVNLEVGILYRTEAVLLGIVEGNFQMLDGKKHFLLIQILDDCSLIIAHRKHLPSMSAGSYAHAGSSLPQAVQPSELSGPGAMS